MKTIDLLKWTMACAFGALVVTSCSDDDDDKSVPVPDAVQSAFETRFGDVGYVEWDREQGGYLVAEFRKDGKDHDAWFDSNGTWLMTEGRPRPRPHHTAPGGAERLRRYYLCPGAMDC